ncbi:MAG: hypothetical protein PHT75_03965 [Bacilli bacterium]|nr:hypothetical protein [Bacilli bacterium]MDD4053969.1 hypothetical protein [Bacilli bacterium]
MDSKYNKSAEQLARQKKQRMRVIKRRKTVSVITTTAVVIALSVGMAFMALDAWDREYDAHQQMLAEYRAENYRPEISQEEKERANIQYYEDHYSPETIDNLKGSIINEYGILIDAIVENEKLQVNTDVEALDSDRLDDAIDEYGHFKATCEKDQVNYATASEEVRIDKAMSLYNSKIDVLEDQLLEAQQKAKYLEPDSSEFLENKEIIENITRKIKSADTAIDVVGDRMVTMDFEKRQAEEGKQK